MDLAQLSVIQPTVAHSYLANICDVRSIIFSFIGVNQDLVTFRFVSKEWKAFVEQYLQQIYGMKKHHIESLRPGWTQLHSSMSEAVRDTIEIAEVRKVVYESFDKIKFIRSIKMLAKINNPSKSTKEGVLAAMYLLVDEEELSKLGDALDWKYFRKKLLNRNFQKSLRTIAPQDLTHEKIMKFEAAIGMEMITEYDQMYASAEARDVYMWATNIVEYKQFLDTLTEEVNQTIKQCEIQNAIEKDFQQFENILGTMKCSRRPIC